MLREERQTHSRFLIGNAGNAERFPHYVLKMPFPIKLSGPGLKLGFFHEKGLTPLPSRDFEWVEEATRSTRQPQPTSSLCLVGENLPKVVENDLSGGVLPLPEDPRAPRNQLPCESMFLCPFHPVRGSHFPRSWETTRAPSCLSSLLLHSNFDPARWP